MYHCPLTNISPVSPVHGIHPTAGMYHVSFPVHPWMDTWMWLRSAYLWAWRSQRLPAHVVYKVMVGGVDMAVCGPRSQTVCAEESIPTLEIPTALTLTLPTLSRDCFYFQLPGRWMTRCPAAPIWPAPVRLWGQPGLAPESTSIKTVTSSCSHTTALLNADRAQPRKRHLHFSPVLAAPNGVPAPCSSDASPGRRVHLLLPPSRNSHIH